MWYVIAGALGIAGVGWYLRKLRLFATATLIVAAILLSVVNYIRFDWQPEPNFYVLSEDVPDRTVDLWTPEGKKITIFARNLRSVTFTRTVGGLIVVYRSGEIMGYRWQSDPDLSTFQYRFDYSQSFYGKYCVENTLECLSKIPDNPSPTVMSQIDLGFYNYDVMLHKYRSSPDYYWLLPKQAVAHWIDDTFVFFYLSKDACIFATDGNGHHWLIPVEYTDKSQFRLGYKIKIDEFPSNWRQEWTHFEPTC